MKSSLFSFAIAVSSKSECLALDWLNFSNFAVSIKQNSTDLLVNLQDKLQLAANYAKLKLVFLQLIVIILDQTHKLVYVIVFNIIVVSFADFFVHVELALLVESRLFLASLYLQYLFYCKAQVLLYCIRVQSQVFLQNQNQVQRLVENVI